MARSSCACLRDSSLPMHTWQDPGDAQPYSFQFRFTPVPQLVAALLFVLLALAAHPAHAMRECQRSGYCSLGHVRPFIGDVWPSEGLKASIAARSFKKELIVISETRYNPALQLVADLHQLGYNHVIILMSSRAKCEGLLALQPDMGCAWSSQLFITNVKFWMDRQAYVARAARLGANVLLLDTDVLLFNDVYQVLKAPPLADHQLLLQRDGDGWVNCGVVYLQNVAADGPAAYAVAEIIDRTQRWADNPKIAESKSPPRHSACLEQTLWSDALISTMAGRPLARFCWAPVLGNASVQSAWVAAHRRALNVTITPDQPPEYMPVDALAQEYKFTSWPEHLKLPGVPRLRSTDFFAPQHTFLITTPHAQGEWPEDVGGRIYDKARGPLSTAWRQALLNDTGPLWPDMDDELPAGHHPVRERFSWFSLGAVSAWSMTGNTGLWSRWLLRDLARNSSTASRTGASHDRVPQVSPWMQATTKHDDNTHSTTQPAKGKPLSWLDKQSQLHNRDRERESGNDGDGELVGVIATALAAEAGAAARAAKEDPLVLPNPLASEAQLHSPYILAHMVHVPGGYENKPTVRQASGRWNWALAERVRRHSGSLKSAGGPDLSGVHEEGQYDADVHVTPPILRVSTPQEPLPRLVLAYSPKFWDAPWPDEKTWAHAVRSLVAACLAVNATPAFPPVMAQLNWVLQFPKVAVADKEGCRPSFQSVYLPVVTDHGRHLCYGPWDRFRCMSEMYTNGKCSWGREAARNNKAWRGGVLPIEFEQYYLTKVPPAQRLTLAVKQLKGWFTRITERPHLPPIIPVEASALVDAVTQLVQRAAQAEKAAGGQRGLRADTDAQGGDAALEGRASAGYHMAREAAGDAPTQLTLIQPQGMQQAGDPASGNHPRRHLLVDSFAAELEAMEGEIRAREQDHGEQPGGAQQQQSGTHAQQPQGQSSQGGVAVQAAKEGVVGQGHSKAREPHANATARGGEEAKQQGIEGQVGGTGDESNEELRQTGQGETGAGKGHPGQAAAASSPVAPSPSQMPSPTPFRQSPSSPAPTPSYTAAVPVTEGLAASMTSERDIPAPSRARVSRGTGGGGAARSERARERARSKRASGGSSTLQYRGGAAAAAEHQDPAVALARAASRGQALPHLVWLDAVPDVQRLPKDVEDVLQWLESRDAGFPCFTARAN